MARAEGPGRRRDVRGSIQVSAVVRKVVFVVMTLVIGAALVEAQRAGAVEGAQRSTDGTLSGEPGGVRVEVSVRSVLREEASQSRALAYVEAMLVGPFFERGRSEALTMRLVLLSPEELGYDGDSYRLRDPYGDNPWGALERFSGGEVEFYRGARLLGRVPQEASWIQVEGLSYSPESGLLTVHLLQANLGSAPSSLDVLHYHGMTDRLERRSYYPAAEAERGRPWLMSCGEVERPWVSPQREDRTAAFEPCRSDVELLEAYHELARTVRTWGSSMLGRDIVGDLSCAECPAVDDATFSAQLGALRRAAAGIAPDSLSVGLFASADFEVVEVQYRSAGDSSWFMLLFSRGRGEDAWRAVYGRQLGYGFNSDYAEVEEFVPDSPHLVGVWVYPCDGGIGCDVFVNLETQTSERGER